MESQTKMDHLKLLLCAILAYVTSVTLNQWVAITAIMYSLMQIGLLLPKYINGFKQWRARRSAVNDR